MRDICQKIVQKPFLCMCLFDKMTSLKKKKIEISQMCSGHTNTQKSSIAPSYPASSSFTKNASFAGWAMYIVCRTERIQKYLLYGELATGKRAWGPHIHFQWCLQMVHEINGLESREIERWCERLLTLEARSTLGMEWREEKLSLTTEEKSTWQADNNNNSDTGGKWLQMQLLHCDCYSRSTLYSHNQQLNLQQGKEIGEISIFRGWT